MGPTLGSHNISLSDRLSRRITWAILALMAVVTIGSQVLMFEGASRMYERQVQTWVKSFPETVLPHLIDSDHFSISSNVRLLESTGLFASVSVVDAQMNSIAHFERGTPREAAYEPIKDAAGTTWGYFRYETNFSDFVKPFIGLGLLSIAVMIALYFLIQRWLTKSLGRDFSQFNEFLGEVERLAQRIAVSEDGAMAAALAAADGKSEEQERINRTFAKLAGEIAKAQHRIREFTAQAAQQKTKDEIAKMAAQVAHDIRSPLSALRMLQKNSASLPEDERRLLVTAVDRVAEIASNILNLHARDTHVPRGPVVSVQPLALVVDGVIAEQRLARKEQVGLTIAFDLKPANVSLSARILEAEFKRTLSNLINNAIEAVPESRAPRIGVALTERDGMVVVSIQDNGSGLTADQLMAFNHHEFGRSSKSEGHGLGLAHAWDTIKSMQGELQFEPAIDGLAGTRVEIALPKEAPPAWMCTELSIPDNTEIVVLDDDPSIHQIWNHRLSGRTLRHFTSYREFSKALNLDGSDATIKRLFLIDHELVGEPITGTEIIRKHGLKDTAILVSAAQRDTAFLSTLANSGIKLLPKEITTVVRIAN